MVRRSRREGKEVGRGDGSGEEVRNLPFSNTRTCAHLQWSSTHASPRFAHQWSPMTSTAPYSLLTVHGYHTSPSLPTTLPLLTATSCTHHHQTFPPLLIAITPSTNIRTYIRTYICTYVHICAIHWYRYIHKELVAHRLVCPAHHPRPIDHPLPTTHLSSPPDSSLC